MGIARETDLYAPVKRFLEGQGYTVRGEVRGCDLVATRGAEVVVVELKTAFNLALVFQGIERQQLTPFVYLAVEAPHRRRGPRWSDVQRLCRRLGLGLLTVSGAAGGNRVEVVCDPPVEAHGTPRLPRRSPKRRSLLLKEFQARSGDHNIGGSTRRPIVTAYREEALCLARYLKQHGPSQVVELRAFTGSRKAGAILQKNYYGWFERVARGVYRLTAQGEREMVRFEEVAAVVPGARARGGAAPVA